MARKAPNAFGIYDMSGNLWEWCRDRYKKELWAQPSVIFDVVGDHHSGAFGMGRVLRGGAFDSKSTELEVSSRRCMIPDHGSPKVGFRVVLNTIEMRL